MTTITRRIEVQYEIVDSDPDVVRMEEDIVLRYSLRRDLVSIEKVHSVEQIPDGVDGDVEDTLIVNERPEL
jgi:hypothetical protein